MSTEDYFRAHYQSLSNEELMHIAITRELVLDAKNALNAELSQRKISDLSEYANAIEKETKADDAWREQQIEHRSQVSGGIANSENFLRRRRTLYRLWNLPSVHSRQELAW